MYSVAFTSRNLLGRGIIRTVPKCAPLALPFFVPRAHFSTKPQTTTSPLYEPVDSSSDISHPLTPITDSTTPIADAVTNIADASAAVVVQTPQELLALTRAQAVQDLPWFVPHVPFEHTGGVFDSLGGVSLKALTWLHETAGLPWWVAIVSVTVCVRLCLLPLMVVQQRMTMKLFNATPILTSFREQIQNPFLTPEQHATLRKEAVELNGKLGIKQSHLFLPILGQAPLFISFFFGLRLLAITEPSLMQGGIGFFTNLATWDKTFILPILSASAFLLTTEINSRGKYSMPQNATMKAVVRSIGLAMIPLTASFPKSVLLYWVINNSFSAFQMALFKVPTIRHLFQIPDPSPEAIRQRQATLDPSLSGQPQLGFWDRLKAQAQTARQEQETHQKRAKQVTGQLPKAIIPPPTTTASAGSNAPSTASLKEGETQVSKMVKLDNKGRKVETKVTTFSKKPANK
eukprot:c8163_g1_i1.p1 GENE.c8163_g1_i1~~c8163_g1_i1.p1  ORF type:complete len:475 (+),score=112.40 c8163_g1_i1:48-1427(+)